MCSLFQKRSTPGPQVCLETLRPAQAACGTGRNVPRDTGAARSSPWRRQEAESPGVRADITAGRGRKPRRQAHSGPPTSASPNLRAPGVSHLHSAAR